MAKRKDGSESSETADHRMGCDPWDTDWDWQRIYAALKIAIGASAAFNWFGCCRFISCDGGVIRLESWGYFQAEECLKRHGRELCKAAGASSAQVAYSGGFRPAWLQGPPNPERHGTAHYVLPVKVDTEPLFRRNVVAESVQAPRRAP